MPKRERKTQLEKRVEFLLQKLRPVILPELASEKPSNKYQKPIENLTKSQKPKADGR